MRPKTVEAFARTRIRGPFWAPDLLFPRADDRIRTGDPNLGKVVLYQLSHVRVELGL